MSDRGGGRQERDKEILELFIEESLEQLQRVEKLLLDAEEGEGAPDLLDTLFRTVHTVKGTSGFLALPKIGALSHAAEDLLSVLREDPSKARPAHFARLVGVVDVLRRLIERVRETEDEGPLDIEALAGRLRADAAALEAAAPASAASAPPPAASLAAGPLTPVAAAQLHRPAPSPAAGIPPAPASASVPLPPSAPVSAAPSSVVEHGPPAPNQPAEAGKDPGAGRAGEGADSSVRVNVTVLDRLMNLMGELVLARNQIIQMHKTTRGAPAANPAALQRLSLVTSEMQEQIMKTRMQPIARVFERIPRMARDLCQATGKRVTCQIDGNATEIDKAVVEAIRDPVMHVVRNAIDHGVELPAARELAGKSGTGTLTVRASHQGGMVLIEIADDGKGMDPKKLRDHAVRRGVISPAEAERLTDREALELVYRPGFSTAEKVTDISGRGVGMDVARTQVERAGGQIELDSVLGRGTTVRLKMPLTLAIIPALLVRACGQRFAIPQANLLELVFLNVDQARTAVEHVRGAPIYRLRGEVLPLVRLRDVLASRAPAPPPADGVSIVVVAVGSSRYGLVVDEIHDTEEIVIKPLHGPLKRLSCYSGATVLGNGEVALILDVAGVAASAGLDVSARHEMVLAEAPRGAGEGMQTMLVFRAGKDAPCAVPLAMVARLELVESSAIETVAGREVLQYRDSIMPIIRPEDVLPLGPRVAHPEQQLVVFDFGQMVGMAIDRIVDIVDVQMNASSPGRRGPSDLTLGRVVIFGHTTLVLDVYELLRRQVPEFTQEKPVADRRRPRLIVADDSSAMRAAVGGFLRAQGIDVIEVSSGEAVLRELRGSSLRPVDAVVTDLEMAGLDGFGVLDAVGREHPEIPVVVWTQHDDPRLRARVMAAGARHCVNKREREALMAALVDCGVFEIARSTPSTGRAA
jgi:two-component system chemotaxis sensor kinase CheA